MNLVHKMTEYYRHSLADAMKKEADRKEFCEDCLINIDEITMGKISEEVTQYIFRQKYTKKYKEAITNNWTVDVIICPLVFKVNAAHGVKATLPDTLVPVMMPAQLSVSGWLKHTDKQPWIDRKLLKPSELDKHAIGDITVLDQYLAENSLDTQEHPSWNYYINYINNMIETVCQTSLVDLSIYNFSLTKDAYVIVDQVVNSTMHLRQFYEHVLEKSIEPNVLSQNLFNFNRKKQKTIDPKECQLSLSGNHIGQMGNQFPLSSSQRETLNHYTVEGDGVVFAVNGPPGTGKTTLLHSIIAQAYVENAANGKQPPVIFATSNNNQAVTNIIDSFTKSGEGENLLASRWITELYSYGAYLVSESKNNIDNYQAIFEKSTTDGYYKKLESEEAIEKSIRDYTAKGNAYFGISQSVKLDKIIEKLKDNINTNVRKIKSTIALLVENKKEIEKLMQLYPKGFEFALKKLNDAIESVAEERASYQLFTKAFDQWFESQFFLVKILMKLNVLKSLYRRNIFEFINKQLMYLNTSEHQNYRAIEDFILSWDSNLSKAEFENKNKLEKIENDRKLYAKYVSKVIQIARSYDCRAAYDSRIYDKINDKMDTSIRYESFMLSVHYYEGLWLKECHSNITNGNEDKKSEKSKIDFWYRMAKITPCFVSTFYMIPKFLKHGGFSDTKEWVNNYLFDLIDILVIDEAGQASPEVCLPLSMLAKKAVIVGDVYQIEPVWGVERYSDIPNIEKYIGKDAVSIMVDRKYAAHNGNLMTIAKQRSNFQKFDEGGLYLTEHRRCLPEIIGYCNELTYKNKLIPMRKNDRADFILPPMLHVDCKGKSAKNAGSRKNEIEADHICQWIVTHAQVLLQYYNSKRDSSAKSLEISEIIAVVTPFKAQSNLIKRKLKMYEGFEDITVGTVHALQGAERQVVIFSTVYDSKDSGNYFFDNGVNMLNVAVSRAKDSFVVIGDSDILKKGNIKPSEILSQYLTESSL